MPGRSCRPAAAASTSRWGSSGGRPCCSWTSRHRLRPRGCRQFWSLIGPLRELGTRCCSPPTTSTRPRRSHRVGVIARGRLVEVAVPSSLGGRESAPAVVRWTEDGVRRSEVTATPTAFVRDLAARFPGGGPDLAVTRPTLEDVYLRMIESASVTTTTAARRRAADAGRVDRTRHGVGAQGVLPAAGGGGLHPAVPGDPAAGLRGGAELRHRLGGELHPVLHGGRHRRRHPGRQPAEHGDQHRHRALDGTLKALAGTPMPKSAYFVGKVVQVLVVTVLIEAILLVIGASSTTSRCRRGRLAHLRVGDGARPRRPAPAGDRGVQPGEERPVGVGDGHAHRAGPAVHLRRLLPVQPGAHLDADRRAVFPLKWMAQGLRSVFLPDALARRSRRARGSSPASLALVGACGASSGLLVRRDFPLAGPR